MERTASKDKRTGIRVPLLSESIVYFHDGVQRAADITDITNEGLFLRTSDVLKPRSDILLQLQLPGDLGNIQVEGKVIRVNWTPNKRKNRENMGMGVKFVNAPANIKKILDAYVVYLRNKQIITVSKRIIEEFFGNDGPKKSV